jgi:rRNA maturation endonuclease Nob1
MRTCEACQREFRSKNRSQTCPYCGFNTNPHGQTPRSKRSLARLEQEQRERWEREEELRDYLGNAPD